MTAAALDLDPGARALGRVDDAREAVREVGRTGLALLDDERLAAVVERTASLRSQVEALELALGAEAEARRVADAAGDTGTDEWLSRLTGSRRELLRGGLRLSRLLQERYVTTAAAFSAGHIRLEQARAIVDGLEISADDATEDQHEHAEHLLVGLATGAGRRSGVPMTSALLRRASRRIYRTIDGGLHERHLSRSVRATSHHGATSTWLSLHDRGDGTWTGRFSIPDLHGQVLSTVLESLSAPRRLGRDRRGDVVADDVAGTDTAGLGWADKLGLALCELIEHLPTDRLGASAVTVMAMVDLATLRSEVDGLGVAATTTGADLTAGDVRRLACDAGILPAVMGGASVPLDLGRTRRLHSEKQRQALAVLHHSCAIATCDRPFAWCEVHHPVPWGAGGATDLHNALPLCGHHHRAVHDRRFDLVRHSDTEWVLRRRRRC